MQINNRSVPYRSDWYMRTESTRRSDGSILVNNDQYSATRTNIFNGFKNPRWRRQVRAGVQAGTSYEVQAGKILSQSPGSANLREEGNDNSTYTKMSQRGCILANPIPAVLSGTYDSDADAIAKSKLFKHYDQERRLFDGATFIAELGDTIRMVKNPAFALRRAVDAWSNRAALLNRGLYVTQRRHSATKHAVQKALAGEWLEWQFGVAPLVNDIANGAKALEEFPFYRHRVLITGKGAVQKSVHNPGTRNERWWKWTYETVENQEWSVRYLMSLDPSVTEKPRSFSEAWGLKTRDFVPALWEWMPYSFLIDYFTNIGELIRAYSNPIVGVKWTMKGVRRTSTKRVQTVKVERAGGTPSYYIMGSWSPYLGTGSSIYLNRVAIADPPKPSFRLKVPGYDSLKWLNIAALIGAKSRNRSLLK